MQNPYNIVIKHYVHFLERSYEKVYQEIHKLEQQMQCPEITRNWYRCITQMANCDRGDELGEVKM